MWGISSSTLSWNGVVWGSNLGKMRFGFGMPTRSSQGSQFASVSRHLEEVSLSHSSRPFKASRVQMTLVDDRLSQRQILVKPYDILAYDLVQGPDVRWSYIMDKSMPEPPTAVLLHGILGSRKNWVLKIHCQSLKAFLENPGIDRGHPLPSVLPLKNITFVTLGTGTFARRLAQEFPKWQFLLVDLRCHGDSASINKRGPHTVASAALDVLKLLGHLRLTPRVVVGHSFGGKVALSLVEQAAKPLARPVRVWVLDATPGKVRAGADGDDHPAELISFLSTLPNEVCSKRDVVDALVQEGFSKDVAQWVVTNLRSRGPPGSSSSSFTWVFNLKGIAEMYQSYEETNLWKIVEDVPRGVHVNFLKAERSLHRWALEDLRRIHAAEEQAVEEGGGVEMHVLEDAGHWVHADNPDGLFKILSFSFQGF